MKKLTADELAAIERAFVPVRDMHAERFRPGQPTNLQRLGMLVIQHLDSLLAEIRESRALLGAAYPCGWDKPRVDMSVTPPLVVAGEEPNRITMEADEAIGIGAAHIEAGRRAKGEIP